MKNRYSKHSRLSEHVFRQILRCFAQDLDTYTTAEITGISRRSIHDIFQKLRKRVVSLLEDEQPFSGEVEVDESYFGPRRVRGKRGRGAGKKVLVLGILKRGGNVYTQVIPRANKNNILPILQGKILEETTVHTDGWTSYDGLIDVKNFKHYRVYHSKDEFVRGKSHINGIESFWSFCKRRMRKQNGVRKDKFLIHLKECEWRWNHRNEDIYQILLKKLRENPL
ncbi:MAG: IS1595 family transposase [Pseudomonadales bacterium]|nr:IS1595 family transposase [Pseudomonadales bacterium]